MTEFFGAWIKGVAAAALISGLAISICPKGKAKGVLKTICGVLMIMAMLSPILRSELPAMSLDIAEYRSQGDKLAGVGMGESDELSRSIIEKQTAAYIFDKASSMGVVLEAVSVMAKWGDGGFWYPKEITVQASIAELDKTKIANIIEAELGITSQGQHWSDNEK